MKNNRLNTLEKTLLDIRVKIEENIIKQCKNKLKMSGYKMLIYKYENKEFENNTDYLKFNTFIKDLRNKVSDLENIDWELLMEAKELETKKCNLLFVINDILIKEKK